MSKQSDCLFCGIAEGRIPADVLHEDEHIVAFRDIDPKAPVHVLVIPKRHVASLADAGPEDGSLLGDILLRVAALARSEGIADGGYRTVLNTGGEGGQTVHHLHVHLFGGRGMTWPPG